MCGFFITNKKLNSAELSTVTKRLSSRGPDDIKIRTSNNGSFIFSRLACTGRKTSSMQPLDSAIYNQDKFFLFNGEIYNYMDLNRKFKIIKKNNLSDTEVLDGLIKKVGFNKAVKELNGAFAIGYVDKTFKNCYLTRDIYGQRPLYYAYDKNNWYVGSDPLSLSFCSNNNVSVKNLETYLSSNEDFGTRGLINPGLSFFNNVYSVTPGDIVFLNKNGFKYIKKDILISNDINHIKKKQRLTKTLKDFNSIMDKIIKSYVGNYNDVCFEFSGGIDSTTLMLSSLKLKKKFTYYIKVAKGIDSIAQKSIEKLKKLKLNFKVVHVNKESYLSDAIKFIRLTGSPQGWGTAPSMMPLYQQMKKDNMKICLGGTGADEFFYGYNNIQKLLKIDFNLVKKIKSIDLIRKFSFSGWDNNKKLNSYVKTINKLINIYKKRKPDFRKNIFSICDFIRFIDLNVFMSQISSPHSDSIAMMHSIEIRSPFLDNEITKIALEKINHEFLLNENSIENTKQFLKKALELRCNDLGLSSNELIENNKEGTRNFAIQAFKELSLRKIPKEFLKELNIKLNSVISSKMKSKIYNIIIFYLIFEKKLTNEKILKLLTGK